MTKQEAKQSLIEGKKIRHKSWMDGTKYFYLSDIVMEIQQVFQNVYYLQLRKNY